MKLSHLGLIVCRTCTIKNALYSPDEPFLLLDVFRHLVEYFRCAKYLFFAAKANVPDNEYAESFRGDFDTSRGSVAQKCVERNHYSGDTVY